VIHPPVITKLFTTKFFKDAHGIMTQVLLLVLFFLKTQQQKPEQQNDPQQTHHPQKTLVRQQFFKFHNNFFSITKDKNAETNRLEFLCQDCYFSGFLILYPGHFIIWEQSIPAPG
jgi:hypothetical protein